MTRNLLFALLLLPLSAFAADPHAVILMYHRFGEDRYPTTSIKLKEFDAQLNYLAANHYHVWPLAQVIEHVIKDQPIPDHTVVITVDDAFLSVYKEAYPRLKARGWPFTVFVNTDPIDKRFPAYMTWADIKEMAAHGVTFYNHTATHTSLTKQFPGEDEAAWAKRERADIDKAQRRLQQELGPTTNTDPKLFVYPYGEYDARAAALVKSMGYIAFGQESGAIGIHSNLRALPRFPMSERFATMDQFKLKVDSLPLPVIQAEPRDPRIGKENPPLLTLTLAHAMPGIACYNADGNRLPIHWLGKDKVSFSVQSPTPLLPPRNRYNCTAPAKEKGRWYWYSHPWLITTPVAPAPATPGYPAH